jgi:hypothetical protein
VYRKAGQSPALSHAMRARIYRINTERALNAVYVANETNRRGSQRNCQAVRTSKSASSGWRKSSR